MTTATRPYLFYDAVVSIGPTAYRKVVEGWDQENFLKYKETWFWSHPLSFKDGKA